MRRLLEWLTGKPRYPVKEGRDFEWSNKSWTHNVFRLFELVFGRQEGIRAESTAGVDEHGVSWVIVHSFEAAIAYTETYLRSLFKLPEFKFVRIYIPQLAPIGGGVPTRLPYLFAIAYDTTARGTGAGGASSVTYSHTCTGSNLTIAVMGCQNNIPIATSSSATYNAVSCTQATTKSNSGQNTWMDIDILAAPATGANNVVWTANQSGVSAFSISLTGTAASPIGASGTPVTWVLQTSTSISVTTTQANSWIVDNTQNNNATATASGSGQTIRNNNTGVGGNRFYGSTMTTTSTGSYSPGYTWSGNTDGTILATEIKANTSSPSSSTSSSVSSSPSSSPSSSTSSSPSSSKSSSVSSSPSSSPSPSSSVSSSPSSSPSSSKSSSPSTSPSSSPSPSSSTSSSPSSSPSSSRSSSPSTSPSSSASSSPSTSPSSSSSPSSSPSSSQSPSSSVSTSPSSSPSPSSSVSSSPSPPFPFLTASRDENDVPSLICASMVDGETIVPIEGMVSTHTLKTNNGLTGSDYGTVNAVRDDNFVPVLLAVSSADGVTPIEVYGNPYTAAVLIMS